MKASSSLSSKEFFVFLLPLFFVLHGSTENFPLVSIPDALELTGIYFLGVLVLLAFCYLLFDSFRKAAFYTFFLAGFYFFFGAVHDFLKDIAPNFFLSKYIFFIPLALLVFSWLFYFLRKTNANLQKAVSYLNIVFLLLLFIDFAVLVFKFSRQSKKETASVNSVNVVSKPDIYLIIADEYADSTSLNQVFKFNNGRFQQALRNRGFHIVGNSRSNYNYTPFSVASLLQMNFITGIKGHNQDQSDRNRCYELINGSPLWRFLKKEGYVIKNHSLFNLNDIPSEAPNNYIKLGKNVITLQTLWSRLKRDLGYHLVTTLKLKSAIEDVSYSMHRCNQQLLTSLIEEPELAYTQPRFVYAHISMPHYPYYFRKSGQPNPIEYLQEGQQGRMPEYIEYLQYSNAVYLETIDHILRSSKQPPIIIFMGDHGFREFSGNYEENAPYYYMNMNAVLLPSGQYREFYNGISVVNQMRALLNTQFNLSLPYLKDSTIRIYE